MVFEKSKSGFDIEVRYRVVIEGISPLLQHNYLGMHGATTEQETKKVPPPEREAELGLYRLPDGTLGHPALGVRKSIIRGSKGYKSGRTRVEELLKSTMMVVPEDFVVLLRDGKPLKRFDQVHVTRAVVQRNAVLRARPLFNLPWEVEFGVVYDGESLADSFLADMMPRIISRAGKVVGIGDWRPETGGLHGRYRLVRYERVV